MATMVDKKCKCCGADMLVRAADVARGWDCTVLNAAKL